MSEPPHVTPRLRALPILLLLCVAAIALPAPAQPNSPPAVVVFNTTDEAAMRAAESDITRAGGLLRHSMPPHVAIFDLPQEVAAGLAGDGRIDLISRGAVDPATLPASYGRAARDAVAAWNAEYIYPEPLPARPPAGARPLIGDAKRASGLVPGRTPRAAALAPPGANQWQTSEYMMGSAAVSLIFLESNGAIDFPDTEDWSDAQTVQVVSKAVGGLNWWASIYPYSAAPLSFTWEYHYAVPTRYEPITRSSDEDVKWIVDALNSLGYPCSSSTYQQAMYEYCNDMRTNHGTDWAFLVFVVNDVNDPDHSFSDGYFAYAWLNGYGGPYSNGGPYVMMTYNNDGWGIGSMDSVLAHETGHIFGADDEYCQTGYSCCDATAYDGYLRIQNTNCDQNPICVMNNSSWAVCTVSRRQLGWRDSDADGIPDILDVAPTASINSHTPDPTGDNTPTFTGSVGVGYFPNQNFWYTGPDVTLNRIANVQYRIDGGPWQDCTPTDGAFDGPTEDYTFTTAPLTDGTYTFEVRAIDTSGNTTADPYPSDTLTVHGDMIDVTVSADPPVIVSSGTVQLTGSATDGKGHNVVSYSWDDGGAGGVFLPSVTTTGPSYTAAANTSGADRTVTLTMSATCDGSPPGMGHGSATVTVKFDFDGDGMPDWWEQEHGFNPRDPSDAALDADGDGLTNLQEYQHGTNPDSNDSDADGMPDNWELQHGLDPTDASDASTDSDHDGLTAVQEYQNGTDPANRDTDGDGFGDAEEVTLGSDPTSAVDKPDHGHFTDVEPSGYGASLTDPFWAFDEIEACFRSGIVSGYQGGSYQPALPVSREQMAVYIARALAGGDANVPTDYTTPSFTDVPTTNWAFNYIEYAAELNVVRGYDAGDYKPLLPVDRGTMAVYIARSIVTPIGDDSSLPRPIVPTFTDVPTQYWSYADVEYCFSQGVVHGYGDGLYYPDVVVSRDQMAVYICSAFDLPR
jgi:hypothetical protein